MKRKLSRDDVLDLLTLFTGGIKQCDLAREYRLDHSTVYYYIKKFKVTPGVFTIEHTITRQVNIIRKPEVKMYADLLRESEERARIARKKLFGQNVENSKAYSL